jgi:hypothetical protein
MTTDADVQNLQIDKEFFEVSGFRSLVFLLHWGRDRGS